MDEYEVEMIQQDAYWDISFLLLQSSMEDPLNRHERKESPLAASYGQDKPVKSTKPEEEEPIVKAESSEESPDVSEELKNEEMDLEEEEPLSKPLPDEKSAEDDVQVLPETMKENEVTATPEPQPEEQQRDSDIAGEARDLTDSVEIVLTQSDSSIPCLTVEEEAIYDIPDSPAKRERRKSKRDRKDKPAISISSSPKGVESSVTTSDATDSPSTAPRTSKLLLSRLTKLTRKRKDSLTSENAAPEFLAPTNSPMIKRVLSVRDGEESPPNPRKKDRLRSISAFTVKRSQLEPSMVGSP